ncbi:penicillin-binding protein [Candidatus Dojkabacteria bacterium]|uniref:peptidoglycan glycosyltransferase n=1 Tax=Candidatus Dojkabacteria bacterium TaxID=2099670 RepID=A0A955L103_9BACT|nr:penicillin-binding protein [Candidatus Dojkabacteria bacterium]
MTKTVKLSSKSRSRRPGTRSSSFKRTAGSAGRRVSNFKSSLSTTKRQQEIRKYAKVALIIIAIILIGMLGGTIYAFSWLQGLNDSLPTVDEVFPDPPISSIIYDRKGTQLYKVIGDVNSDPVNIDEIPERVKWPFIAAEDESFYKHDGFDTAAILRCGINIAKSGGSDFCGGSTITQQLIKITALRDVQSKVERKIQELFMATKVEQANTKDDILGMYLTVTSYGSNIVGIQSASRFYFDKDPKDLTLAEAAILASIVQNPSYLSPTQPYDGDTESSQERVKQRQLYVLGQIQENKDEINDQIETNERQKAKEEGVEFKPEEVEYFTDEMIADARDQVLEYKPPFATDIKAGHFVNFALKELQEKNYKNGEEPFTEEDLHNGGYRIYTTLDYDLQQIAEKYAAFGGNNYLGYNVHNAAVMTTIPKTGEILTMAGSKSFTGDSEGCDENGANCLFNPEVNVLATLQSPGSTNKAMAYYLAYVMGITYPGDFLPDVPISIGGYTPKNWNGGYDGIDGTTTRQMLRRSRNIPALILTEAIGVHTYLETSREFGYTTYEDESQFGHSVAIGGTAIYPYEHVAAFGVFATQGDYTPVESILRIEDSQGNIIYEADPEPKEVGSAQGAFLLNQTLLNNENLSWDGRDIAAKTGTSESNIDSSVVAWTPDMVTMAWVGNNNNEPTNPYYGYASIVVSPWLRDYLREIGGSEYFQARTPFERPGFITRGGGSCNSDGQCIGLESDWMISNIDYKSYITQKEVYVCSDQQDKLARDIDIALGLAVKKTFKQYRMPAPTWQSFLDAFVAKNGGNNSAVPTEYCDIDRSGLSNGPVITYGNISADTNTLSVSMKAYSVSSQIDYVDVIMDGNKVGSVTSGFPDFSKDFNIKKYNFTSGQAYSVRIIAYDLDGKSDSFDDKIIIGNSGSQQGSNNLSFTFLEATTGTLNYSDISQGTAYNVRVQYNGSVPLQSVTLILSNLTVGTVQNITMVDQGGGVYLHSAPGSQIPNQNAVYEYTVQGVTQSGTTFQSTAPGTIEIVAN